MTAAEPKKINDAATMRAVAHPARLELLEYLSTTDEGATATQCAAVIGLSPSATSYHLRALAKVGMIEDAPGRGDGRERVWRTRYRDYSIRTKPRASVEDLAAQLAIGEAVLARQNEIARRFLARYDDEPVEWADVATITDGTLSVTPDELRSLIAELMALLEPYRRRDRKDPPATARSVSLQLRAIPLDPPPPTDPSAP